MIMEEILDFLRAALPWIAMGLLLAVYFAQRAGKKGCSADYAAEGMGCGMCFGLCLFTALGLNIGLGLSLGMLSGMVLGACIRKGNPGEDNEERK